MSLQDKEPVHAPGLESGEDLRFEQRSWYVQRAVWCLMGLVVLGRCARGPGRALALPHLHHPSGGAMSSMRAVGAREG